MFININDHIHLYNQNDGYEESKRSPMQNQNISIENKNQIMHQDQNKHHESDQKQKQRQKGQQKCEEKEKKNYSQRILNIKNYKNICQQKQILVDIFKELVQVINTKVRDFGSNYVQNNQKGNQIFSFNEKNGQNCINTNKTKIIQKTKNNHNIFKIKQRQSSNSNANSNNNTMRNPPLSRKLSLKQQIQRQKHQLIQKVTSKYNVIMDYKIINQNQLQIPTVVQINLISPTLTSANQPKLFAGNHSSINNNIGTDTMNASNNQNRKTSRPKFSMMHQVSLIINPFSLQSTQKQPLTDKI